ncbi:hypothetical protein [Pseudonocardia sp. KRD291]|uniref:hypothetical protein n=1 Tax=Pseudonocardia sp. KRD291 TaxID=2792007 RepID=UPI001C49FB20|nr:hypothetical protein [Pseudonocardia sp. KRD291]MBW0104656.1 hypothetical protein [Pseudonocardia sp. KRD291]
MTVLVSLLAGGIGGFVLGRENPSDDAVRDRIAERMADAFVGTPFGDALTGAGASGATGGDAAADAAASVATPVTVGAPNPVNFGGTDDSLTFTVTGATRQSNCPGARGGMLVLRVDIATGSVFNQNDMPFSRYSYIDRAGVTHTNVSSTAGGEKGYDSDAPASCSDGLPAGREMKPDSRYTGSVLLDLPADATTLTFSANDYDTQKEWTLEIPTA